MSLIKIKQVAGLQAALDNAGGGAFPALMGKWDQDTDGNHYFERVGDLPDLASHITSLKFPVDPLSGNPFRGAAKGIEDLFASGGYIVMTGKGQESAEASFSDGWTWIFECDGPPTFISGTDNGKEFSCTLVYGSDFFEPEFNTDVYTFFFVPKPTLDAVVGGEDPLTFRYKVTSNTAVEADGDLWESSSGYFRFNPSDLDGKELPVHMLMNEIDFIRIKKEDGSFSMFQLIQATHDSGPVTKVHLRWGAPHMVYNEDEITIENGDVLEFTFSVGKSIIITPNMPDNLNIPGGSTGSGFLRGRLYWTTIDRFRYCQQGGTLNGVFFYPGPEWRNRDLTGYESVDDSGMQKTTIPSGDYDWYELIPYHNRNKAICVSINGLVIPADMVSVKTSPVENSGDLVIMTPYAVESDDVITIQFLKENEPYV